MRDPNGTSAVVDHQAHWYPRSCVEALAGRSAYPRAERSTDGRYVLLLDDGVSQPSIDMLTMDVEEHLARATAAGIDMLVKGAPLPVSELPERP